jgi:3-oxoacyl-(acyl-carrier-protein) synthase III
MTNHAKILSVDTYLAPQIRTIEEIEQKILNESSAKNLPVSFIKKMTGVEQVHHKLDTMQASDLAVYAAWGALEKADLKPAHIDLLIFASASQDLIEPATAHIVSDKVGFNCPVMDIKNACNSFLNGLQVANAFITTGQYKTVMVVSGETPSMAVRWNNPTKNAFSRSFAGFSMSDAGAAMIITKDSTKDSTKGIHHIEFEAMSSKWDVGMLRMGGSMAPRDLEATYFDMDGSKLYDAFLSLGSGILEDTLKKTHRTWDDFSFVGVHQISMPYLKNVCKILKVPYELIIPTIKNHGNMASVSLPFQLQKAIEQGLVKTGDDFALVGFGGGISTGIGVFTL